MQRSSWVSVTVLLALEAASCLAKESTAASETLFSIVSSLIVNLLAPLSNSARFFKLLLVTSIQVSGTVASSKSKVLVLGFFVIELLELTMVEIERFFPVASFPVASFPVALSKCKVLGFLATESVDVTAERFFPGGEISSSIPGVDRDERPVSEDEGVAVSLISEAAASEAEGDTMV